MQLCGGSRTATGVRSWLKRADPLPCTCPLPAASVSRSILSTSWTAMAGQMPRRSMGHSHSQPTRALPSSTLSSGSIRARISTCFFRQRVFHPVRHVPSVPASATAAHIRPRHFRADRYGHASLRELQKERIRTTRRADLRVRQQNRSLAVG